MMLQMPEEVNWEDAMRMLTRIENVHLTAEMWQQLEPKELPKPRSKEKATVNGERISRAAKKGSSWKERRQGKGQ